MAIQLVVVLDGVFISVVYFVFFLPSVSFDLLVFSKTFFHIITTTIYIAHTPSFLIFTVFVSCLEISSFLCELSLTDFVLI